MTWKAPDSEMVAYRSFSPFLPLLACFESPVVQLWAAWAINHVVSKNPKRYCEMLLEPRTLMLFKGVIANAQLNNDCALLHYCEQTLVVVRDEYPQLNFEIYMDL